MGIVLKLLSIICGLVALFLTVIIVIALVHLAGGNYRLKPAFAGFVVVDIVAAVAAARLWRRSRRPVARA